MEKPASASADGTELNLVLRACESKGTEIDVSPKPWKVARLDSWAVEEMGDPFAQARGVELELNR